ncbi:MAG: hypothetical protein O7D27_11225 [Alphaproteobacteria bacterium]|nr:hypothetical protein [Alphaproteobacteria bacterium]MCZ6742715.1 hypothetical protein [Alphaproteobacteria bacterium]
MKIQDVIVSIINALPEKKIEGKKRLQKLVYLVQYSDLETNATYKISHFGPFSRDVAKTIDLMVAVGLINEREEPSGIYGTYKTVYSLPSNIRTLKKLPEKQFVVASEINRYTTIELEVASTIAFFMRSGNRFKTAVEKTKNMKPSKAIPPVIQKAEKIVEVVKNAN